MHRHGKLTRYRLKRKGDQMTKSGNDPRVLGLVYIAAFASDN
jgi:hypothetical protein